MQLQVQDITKKNTNLNAEELRSSRGGGGT